MLAARIEGRFGGAVVRPESLFRARAVEPCGIAFYVIVAGQGEHATGG